VSWRIPRSSSVFDFSVVAQLSLDVWAWEEWHRLYPNPVWLCLFQTPRTVWGGQRDALMVIKCDTYIMQTWIRVV
jgi:hypothetical protein